MAKERSINGWRVGTRLSRRRQRFQILESPELNFQSEEWNVVADEAMLLLLLGLAGYEGWREGI